MHVSLFILLGLLVLVDPEHEDRARVASPPHFFVLVDS